MAKIKKGWTRKWLGTPAIHLERVFQSVHLVAYSDPEERRHVYAYTDRDGWHGYYMKDGTPDTSGLMISWHKCHWKDECVTSHTEQEGCV